MAAIDMHIKRVFLKRVKKIEESNVSLDMPDFITSEYVKEMIPEGWKHEPQRWKESVYTILHIMINKTHKNSSGKNKTKNVHLSATYLKLLIGNQYKLVLDTLINNKVIKLKKKANIGVKSAGYQLVEKTTIWEKRYVTLSDKTLIKRWKKYRVEKTNEQLKLHLKHKELVYSNLKTNIKISKTQAEIYIESMRKLLQIIANHKVFEKEHSKKEFLQSTSIVLEHYSQEIAKLNSADIKFSTSFHKLGGRFFTPISNMPSSLRYFLTIDDEELVYLDISNSQPFHLLLTLKHDFWKERSTKRTSLAKLDSVLLEQIIKVNKEEYSELFMFLKAHDESCLNNSLSEFCDLPYDVKKFQELVCTGKLYEFMHQKFKSQKFIKGQDIFKDKHTSKQTFIQMLYSDSKYKGSPSSAAMNLFRKEFPTIARIIRLLKTNSNSSFALLLQKIESIFILEKVCKALLIKNPNIPLFTIHDGIITKKQYQRDLEQAIEKAYLTDLGFAPNLKFEELKPKSAWDQLENVVNLKHDDFVERLQENTEISPEYIISLIEQKFSQRYSEFDLPEYGYIPDYSFLSL
jgi:hypothetical protein